MAIKSQLVTVRLERAEAALVRRHRSEDRRESLGQTLRRLALEYAQSMEPRRCAECRKEMGDEPSAFEDEEVCKACWVKSLQVAEGGSSARRSVPVGVGGTGLENSE